MKIVRIVPLVGDAAWESLKGYISKTSVNRCTNEHRSWEVTYKLKGNKHHRTTVFGIDEMQAFTHALKKLNTIQGESNEFR